MLLKLLPSRRLFFCYCLYHFVGKVTYTWINKSNPVLFFWKLKPPILGFYVRLGICNRKPTHLCIGNSVVSEHRGAQTPIFCLQKKDRSCSSCEPLGTGRWRILETKNSKYSYLWISRGPRVGTDTKRHCGVQLWRGGGNSGAQPATFLVFEHLHALKRRCWCLSYFHIGPCRLDFSSILDKTRSQFFATLEIS